MPFDRAFLDSPIPAFLRKAWHRLSGVKLTSDRFDTIAGASVLALVIFLFTSILFLGRLGYLGFQTRGFDARSILAISEGAVLFLWVAGFLYGTLRRRAWATLVGSFAWLLGACVILAPQPIEAWSVLTLTPPLAWFLRVRLRAGKGKHVKEV